MINATFKGWTDIDSNAKVAIETGSQFCPTRLIEVSNQVTREKLDSLWVGAEVRITISNGKAVIH